MTLEERLSVCRVIVLLKNYRPRKRKAKRSVTARRRRLVRQLRRA